MDLWVVAAATGAGYAAKYWKNFSSREQEGSPELCFGYSIQTKTKTANPLQNIQDQTFIFPRRSVPKKPIEDVFVDGIEVSDVESSLTSFPLDSSRKPKTRNETNVKIEFCSDSFCRLSRCRPKIKTLLYSDSEYSEPKQQIEVSTRKIQSKGFPDETLFVFVGITLGIMSVIVAKNEEAENLNSLLNEKDGLIRDLQEDLETEVEAELKRLDEKPILLCDTNVDNAEKMSRIEAELEAELERLEENLKSSEFDRISDYFELNSDVEEDIVHGDLKLKNIDTESVSFSDSKSNRSGESTNQTDTPNYVLSPKDLSLRLHKVIQSRLEARVAELETLLESSQKRLHSLETESIIIHSSHSRNDKNEKWSKNNFAHDDPMRLWEEQTSTSRSWGSYENSESEEDNNEIGKLLIRQIVEKTRRFSGRFECSKNVV